MGSLSGQKDQGDSSICDDDPLSFDLKNKKEETKMTEDIKKEATVYGVNGWTDYGEKIGNDLYNIHQDGYSMYHIKVHKNNSLFPTSEIIVGYADKAEEILAKAREAAGVERSGWLRRRFYG